MRVWMKATLLATCVWMGGFLVGQAWATVGKYEYPALIRCSQPLQEDSAANPILVRYGDGKITYRCSKP